MRRFIVFLYLTVADWSTQFINKYNQLKQLIHTVDYLIRIVHELKFKNKYLIINVAKLTLLTKAHSRVRFFFICELLNFK